MKIFKFLLFVTAVFGGATSALAQGGCVYFPTPPAYQVSSNTNVYRVAAAFNASGSPVTADHIYTDNTISSEISQTGGVSVPTRVGDPIFICAAPGPYTIQFNSTPAGPGFFSYNFVVPPDATLLNATTLKIVDPTDATKVLKFTTSGMTTAKTLTIAASSANSRTYTLPDAGGAATFAFANPTTAQTISNTTLTSPIIATGLTASGSAANDFSASTGTFKSSTGTVTLGTGGISITGLPTFTAGLLASGAVANDFSGSTGTFLTSTGVNTFGGSANNMTVKLSIAATSAQLALGTTNITTLSALSPAGSATVAIGTTTGTLAPIYSCGTSVVCGAAAATANVKAVYGSAPLSSASPSTASITTLPFTSSASYFCTATPEGTTAAVAAGGIAINKTSGSAMTLTGPNTVTTVIDFVCYGT